MNQCVLLYLLVEVEVGITTAKCECDVLCYDWRAMSLKMLENGYWDL